MQSDSTTGLHVAIVMDGNGRWATRRSLPRVAGHRAGVAALRRVVERAPDLEIAILTVYAFSSDNWRRPRHEVQGIFWLMRAYLRLELGNLCRRGVRLQFIGRRDRLPRALLLDLVQAESATARGSGLHLRVAVDYSSRDAIAQAAANSANGLSLDRPVCSERMRQVLTQELTAEGGDVDLLIRTGGEKRLSDFLLWETAYAELLFVDRLWPDFDAADLDAALSEFSRRERRFGAVPASAMHPATPSVGGAR
jgi:undecaprenyl diphosphate synthase